MAASAIPELITPAGVILKLARKAMLFPTRRSNTDLISSGWVGTSVEGSSY